MSGDPAKLVRFVCVAKAHATGHGESQLTIHEGLWAFCGEGTSAMGHEWRPADGLPIADAMRYRPPMPPVASGTRTHSNRIKDPPGTNDHDP